MAERSRYSGQLGTPSSPTVQHDTARGDGMGAAFEDEESIEAVENLLESYFMQVDATFDRIVSVGASVTCMPTGLLASQTFVNPSGGVTMQPCILCRYGVDLSRYICSACANWHVLHGLCNMFHDVSTRRGITNNGVGSASSQ